MPALRPLLTFAAALTIAVGCGSAPDEEVDDPDLTTSATGATTVYGASTTSCSTIAVQGLSQQLIDELACLDPNAVTKIEANDNLSLEPEVFPYLQAKAADALKSAVAAYGKPMKLNSALRTLPQQYMLRRWSLRDRCGVRVAAQVGSSNHESGLAVDIDMDQGAVVNKAIRTKMIAAGFAWKGSGDPMHYDFTGESKDLEGLSILAFKRLWNRNHPEAKLPLTNTYDALTEQKLRISPADGFQTGARCDDPTP
jgi:D-alanyl-D-alanine dipeptidase